MNNFYSYRMEDVAQGRFDVHAENGMRVGHVIGGNGQWTAEVGNKVVGQFSAKEACAEAILDHRGVVSIKAQMAAIIEARTTMQKDAKQDFYVEDVRFLDKWHCATNLIWIVKDGSTQLQALDCPFSADTIHEVLEISCPENQSSNCTIYLIDFDTLKVKEVTEENVRSMVFYSPKYDLQGNKVKRYGEVIAEILVAPSHERGQGGVRLCHVTMQCLKEPSAGTTAVLGGLAFEYIRRVEREKYAAPTSVEVRSGSKTFYTWPAKEM